jgi:hypothetical protein
MPPDLLSEAQAEIRHMLKRINDAWVKGRTDDLEEFFHEQMVIAHPGSGSQGRGRQACVESYRTFTSQATVRRLKESHHHIDVWDDTAVATYRFELDYEMKGETHRDVGTDLFVFVRQQNKWRAVWRTIIPQGEER